MERHLPHLGSEQIEIYLRTYYSLLRSTSEVQIRTLEEAHAGMKSLLHPDARESFVDVAALSYCLLRLPACILQTRLIVLGQGPGVFLREGFGKVETWERVAAPARRRRSFFDGRETLACYIASRSDIDDLIPQLTALQIELNKLHRLLQDIPPNQLASVADDELAAVLQMTAADLERLQTIWGDAFASNLQTVQRSRCRLRVQLISGSLTRYRRATHAWLSNIIAANPALLDRPVYFVSSNTHSLVNLVSGFALQRQEELVRFVEHPDNPLMLAEWQDIQSRESSSIKENFLYYTLRKYKRTPAGSRLVTEQLAHEQECGIVRIASEHSFDVDAQVIDLAQLKPEFMDPRLCEQDRSHLQQSDALILNIDYPLGLAAYNILTQVSERAGQILGVYIMGKAASLNAAIGDVVIPKVVHDEHSRNTYLIPNCITTADVLPYLVYGAALDNQKAVTVLGTFLQTVPYMNSFFNEGYTDVEMEAGPYLSAVYEMTRPQRYPVDEIVSLHDLPLDLGVVHYASDTPLSRGKNLGAGSLSYFGLDPTYATALAVVRRIFQREKERLA
ncbi:MAG: hypothetical protein ACE5FI_04445 [Anaerolineales bacterium]